MLYNSKRVCVRYKGRAAVTVRTDYASSPTYGPDGEYKYAEFTQAPFIMAEMRPDNIPEVVAEVRKMRAEQELSEAAEKGAVAGAKITATATKPD